MVGDGHMTDNDSMTKKKMTMIIVDSDGEIISAANGHVSSENKELVRLVKRGAALGSPTQLVPPFGTLVNASLDDPEDNLAITAALFSAKPGRTFLLEAPADVKDWIEADSEENGEVPSLYTGDVRDAIESTTTQLLKDADSNNTTVRGE